MFSAAEIKHSEDAYTYPIIDDKECCDTLIIGAGVSGLYTALRLLEDKPDLKLSIIERNAKAGGRLDSDLITLKGDQIREEQGGMRFDNSMRSTLGIISKVGLLHPNEVVRFPMDKNLFYFRGKNFNGGDVPDIWPELWNLSAQRFDFPSTWNINDEAASYVTRKGGLWKSELDLKAPDSILLQALYRILTYNLQFQNDSWPNWAKEGKKPEQPDQWGWFRLNMKWPSLNVDTENPPDSCAMNFYTLSSLLLTMGYSNESIDIQTHALGFRMPYQSNGNAGDALQLLLDFPPDPSYFTLKKGFDQVILHMLWGEILKIGADGKRKYPNAKYFIWTSAHKVAGERKIKFDDHNFSIKVRQYSQGIKESNENIKPDQNCDFNNSKILNFATIDTKTLILTCPQNAMDILYRQSPFLNNLGGSRRFLKSIQSLAPQYLTKINLYFDHPWWYKTVKNPVNLPPTIPNDSCQVSRKRQTQFAGPFFTDLPINSVYQFYAIKEENNPDAQWPKCFGKEIESKVAALTIYCDWSNGQFWEGLQKVGPSFDSEYQKQFQRKKDLFVPASQAVVDEILRQLAILFKDSGVDFGRKSIPDPILTSYRIWNGEDEFPIASYQWKVNVDDEKVMNFMKAPFREKGKKERLPIHVVGETWSDQHGWVNGAIRSSERLLTDLIPNFQPISDHYKFNPENASEQNSLDGVKDLCSGKPNQDPYIGIWPADEKYDDPCPKL